MSTPRALFHNEAIIANEKNIFDPKVYDVIKPGQILAWRTQNYNALGNYQTFTLSEMSKFMDISIPEDFGNISSEDFDFDLQGLDFDLRDFENFEIENPTSGAKKVYVMLDSSFISHNDVAENLHLVNQMVLDHFSDLIEEDVETIFVKNPVSKVETKFKQVGKRFEGNTQLTDRCSKYLDILENDNSIIDAGFSCIFDFSMADTSEIFNQLEKEALEKKYEFFNDIVFDHIANGLEPAKIKTIMADLKYRFFSKFRNEINDDAQLEMAKILKNKSEEDFVVIFTDDRRLSNKFQRSELGVFGSGNFEMYLNGSIMYDEKYTKFGNKK